ncbi:hypothetical protein HAX54_018778 [Datura stramonium]|uniref:Uncharacterized protein n=1 Tax=Datura stramonium TaxID=4076 RepID=A0ABS8UMY1_DATST|nr:hypothetical protein [Datura stramonium]
MGFTNGSAIKSFCLKTSIIHCIGYSYRVEGVENAPAGTSHDKIELQENAANSKALIVALQVASEKLLIENVSSNIAATYVVQIRERGQSNISDKAGVTVDVGA